MITSGGAGVGSNSPGYTENLTINQADSGGAACTGCVKQIQGTVSLIGEVTVQ